MRPVLLLTLVFLCACGGGEAKRNVVLVITDTVRADKLGCYGNPRGLTPNLDAFAAEGLRFENASSHAPWTLPSIATMLTGLHPKEHGAGGRMGEFTRLNRSVTTLPAAFGQAGYATHCIANVGFLDAGTHVTRDFESVDLDAPTSNLEMRDATATTSAALKWIDAQEDGPFFLLVHYFDPHGVYNPPQPFRQDFALPPDKRAVDFMFPRRDEMVAIRDGNLPPVMILRRAEALHDGEIAYMDSQVGRLLAGLESRGLNANTVVAITGDHGEEFLEHGGFEHGHQLYQELTHVPLLLRAPGLEPQVVDAVVGHIDLSATLCFLADVAPDEQFLHFGRSLVGEDGVAITESRSIIAHGNMWSEPLTSLRLGDEKLIRRGDGSFELYDLRVDGEEQHDLASSRAVRVEELAGMLEEMQSVMRKVSQGEAAELSEETLKALAAQGYSAGDEDE